MKGEKPMGGWDQKNLQDGDQKDTDQIGQAKAQIEAILFTMGRAVPLADIAAAIGHDVETTRKLVHSLMDDYQQGKRGIQIVELEDAFQMCTEPACYEAIIRLSGQAAKPVLTDAMLEALSIIAYKQPVTRAMVEKIRGVNSDHVINRLVEYGLVEEVGRLDAPGRPILFGTTEEFLRTFGLHSKEELPQIDAASMEEMRQEAKEEAWH